MLAAVVAGLAPALKATRPNLMNELKSDVAATHAGGRRWTLRDGLVVTQIAVTMVLLVAAGLLTRSLVAAQHVSIGFRTGGLAIVSTEMNMLGYDAARAQQFYDRALERVRAIPGVESAALAERLPFSINYNRNNVFLPDRHGPDDKGLVLDVARVSPEYFATLGVPLFRAAISPRRTRPRRRASHRERGAWRGSTGRIRTPLGKRIRLRTYNGPEVQVVGVSADYKVSTVGEGATPYMHYAVSQQPDSGEEIVARTRGDAGALLSAMRRELLALEPNVLFLDNQTMDAQVAATLLPAKAGAISVSAVGVVAMLLASIGLYGVIAYSVARRTREIGIRMALGAQPSAVVALVMRQGLGLAAVGVGVGAVLALGAAKAVAGALYGVSFIDPVAWSAAIATLLVVATIANSSRPPRVGGRSVARAAIRVGDTSAGRPISQSAGSWRTGITSLEPELVDHRSPPHPNRSPQQPAEGESHADHLADRRGEVRVDRERDAGEQLGPPLLFLAVDEQHEPDAARNEREEQPGRVEVHRSIIAPAHTAEVVYHDPHETPTRGPGDRHAVHLHAGHVHGRSRRAHVVHRRRGDDPRDADGDGAGARSRRARWSSST